MAAAYESMLVCENDGEIVEKQIADGVALLAGEHPRFHVERDQPRDVRLRFGVSWRSWGERITIRAEVRSIRIISVCSFPLQFIDWGKNRENVELVRSALRRAAPC